VALTDDDKRRQLRRMKRMATGLLLAAAVVYVVFRWLEETHSWAGFVRATAEAAMVGALADWFAVTALFRHPLGLPIPHTAIIPRRKDQIGASLGDFVRDNFLTPDVLDERLTNAQVAVRLGEWLRDPQHARTAGGALADAVHGALEVLDDRQIGGAVEHMVRTKVEETLAAPLVARGIDLAIDGGHHRPALTAAFRGLDEFVQENRTTFRTQLTRESPWWVPESIDDRIFEKVVGGVHRFLTDLAANPDHEVRAAIEAKLLAFAQRLRTDPELLARGESWKRELLDHPDARAWFGSLWGEVKATTLAATADPDSDLRQRLDEGLRQFGERLTVDVDLQAKVDEWVRRAAGHIVLRYRDEVSDLIAGTVSRWDADATAERMELQVGRDLQFIRINGTIVGGLAGLAIYTISHVVF
jgi:uncharacterized membrane-anchored protein YjiN (DUF445 family)